MKKIVFIYTFSLGFITYIPCSLNAQQTIKTPIRPLTYEVSYIGDNVNNLSGGIKTGTCYLGMANFRLNFTVEKAGFWNASQFFINAANTHGASPSSELLGDMQVASNIDAGNHTYFQEVWFKQSIGKIEFTVGLQDLNVEFANSGHGAIFLNSSFGILPIISNNFTAPIFPLTTLGLTTKWNITGNSSWINAIYDGRPTDFDYNPYNVKWQFNSGDGLLAISEYQCTATFKELLGTYKIGVYSHSHIVEQSFNKKLPDSLNHNQFGLYTYADQKIWVHANRCLGIFTQLGYSPSDESTICFYLGIGMNYSGLFSRSGKDILGLGIAHEQFNNNFYSETAIELTYQYQITKSIFVQPDLQYIINPVGTGEKLNNILAANFRLGIHI